MRFFFAARRSWKIRAVPASTVSSPPHTAASRIATPNGRLQCQPKKWNVIESVFWVMKINNTIRIRKPAINADHSAAARVNLTAVSGGGRRRVGQLRSRGGAGGRRRLVG